MHIVSNVVGRLRPDADALDALFAGFPAGTVSGAPKVRACQIIAELEASDYRGWYVLEQDTMLSGPPHGPGPMADVRASAKFLQALLHTSVSSH